MAVDVPETEEVTFTLITNKKSKEKGKASSLTSSTNLRNKISLVSRAFPVSKTVTASTASKPAATCPSSAVTATIISKSA